MGFYIALTERNPRPMKKNVSEVLIRMARINFETGDKVVTIKFGELREGVVKNVYKLDPPIVVVEFEDGNVEKVLYSDVAPAPKNDTQENVSEPVANPEITITRGEFMEITCRVIAEEINSVSEALTLSYIMAKIDMALFVDR